MRLRNSMIATFLGLLSAPAFAAEVPEELIGLWDKNKSIKICRQGISDSHLSISKDSIGFFESSCDIKSVERKSGTSIITSKCVPNEMDDDNNSYRWSLQRKGDRLIVTQATVGKKGKAAPFTLEFCKTLE